MRRNHQHDDDRPSLFGDDFALDAPASKRIGPQPVSMLSGLESRKPRRRTAGAQPAGGRHLGWWAGAGLLLASVLTVAVVLLARSPSFSNPLSNPLKAAPVAPRAGAQGVAAAPASQPVPPAPLTARLETLPATAAPATPAPAPAPASATATPSQRVPAAAAVLVAPTQGGLKAAVKVDPAASAGAAATAAQPTQAGQAAQAAQAAQATQTARLAPSTAADKAGDRNRPGGAPASASDADVDLLTALMSHPNLAPPASSANVQRVAATPAVAPPAAPPSSARVARNAAAPNAAKPRVDQSIAALVSNCNARTNKQDALACRRRICEGYWGKAQACPRELQGPPGQSSAPVAPATGRDKA